MDSLPRRCCPVTGCWDDKVTSATIDHHLFCSIVQFLVFCIRKDGGSSIVLAMFGHGKYQPGRCQKYSVKKFHDARGRLCGAWQTWHWTNTTIIMARFLDIPVDLLPLILQHLVRPNHLAASRLVNSSFGTFAVPFLFEQIFIFAWHKDAKIRVIALTSLEWNQRYNLDPDSAAISYPGWLPATRKVGQKTWSVIILSSTTQLYTWHF